MTAELINSGMVTTTDGGSIKTYNNRTIYAIQIIINVNKIYIQTA